MVAADRSSATTSTQKKQNTRRVLDDSVRKIYRAGIFVHAGFIVGFDSEKDGVAAGMTDFIEAAAIPVCMVGLRCPYLIRARWTKLAEWTSDAKQLDQHVAHQTVPVCTARRRC
jgi:hypothetical protein